MLISKLRRRKHFARAFWLFQDGGDGSSDAGSFDGGSSTGSEGADSGSGGDDASTSNSGSDPLNLGVEVDIESAVAEHEKEKSKWDELIPEEYREKPYIQNILKSEKPDEQLFKEFDGLQKKLGERSSLAVPKEDASEEDWNNFYKQIGRPEKPDDYAIKKTEWGDENKAIGEFIDSMRTNETFEKGLKDLFYKAGATSKQVDILASGFDELMINSNRGFFEEAATASSELNKDYAVRMKDIFGNRAETVQEVGKKIIDANVPDNVKPLIKELDNKSLAVLAAVLDNVNAKYIKEDGKLRGGGSSGGNEKEAREQGRALMAHPAFRDVEHPDHDRINEQVKQHYASMY